MSPTGFGPTEQPDQDAGDYLARHSGTERARYFPDLDDIDAPERRFRCSSCGCEFDEFDTQQVQPDGHYACPFERCGDDTLTEVA